MKNATSRANVQITRTAAFKPVALAPMCQAAPVVASQRATAIPATPRNAKIDPELSGAMSVLLSKSPRSKIPTGDASILPAPKPAVASKVAAAWRAPSPRSTAVATATKAAVAAITTAAVSAVSKFTVQAAQDAANTAASFHVRAVEAAAASKAVAPPATQTAVATAIAVAAKQAYIKRDAPAVARAAAAAAMRRAALDASAKRAAADKVAASAPRLAGSVRPTPRAAPSAKWSRQATAGEASRPLLVYTSLSVAAVPRHSAPVAEARGANKFGKLIETIPEAPCAIEAVPATPSAAPVAVAAIESTSERCDLSGGGSSAALPRSPSLGARLARRLAAALARATGKRYTKL